MLNILRKKGVMKRLLWCIAVVIIISFGFLGQAYLLRNQKGPQYAGKVFGKTISLKEFDHQYRQTQLQDLLMYGKNFEKVRDQLNLEAETWDRIILLKECEKQRIRVTNEEVIEAVEQHPFFLIDGKFNALIYKEILANNLRMNPRQFEEGMRDTLKITKLYEEETSQINIPEEEVLSAYQKDQEQVQVNYVLLESSRYTDQINDDEEKIREYFLTHRQEFTLPPMVNLEYILIPFEKSESATGTSDGEDPAQKSQGSEGDGPPGSPQDNPTKQKDVPDDVKDAAFEKALIVLEDLEGGEDFQAAEKHGLEITRTGLFNPQQPLLLPGWSFSQLKDLTGMAVGQPSEPIEVPDGFQIVRVTERTKARTPSFEEVHDKAAQAWRLNEAQKIAFQKAKEIEDALQASTDKDLAHTAETFGLNIQETDLFKRGGYLPKLGYAPAFQEAAFQLNEDHKISAVIETPAGYTILQFKKFVAADQEKFKEVREAYDNRLLLRRKERTFREFLARLRIKANLQDYVSERIAKQKEEQRAAEEEEAARAEAPAPGF